MTPELAVGIALCVVFIVFALLMYSGRMPALIALPLLATALFVCAGAFYPDLQNLGKDSGVAFTGPRPLALLKAFLTIVVGEGMQRMWKVMIAVILGAVLAEQLKTSGAGKAIVRWAGELGGDNPTVVCFLLTAACAVLFTSLGGLGAVIMVAGIVLPVILALGVSAEAAGCIFLFGLCLGGVFNPVNWQFFISALKLTTSQVLSFVVPMFIMFAAAAAVFIVLNTRGKASSFWAVNTAPEDSAPDRPVGFFGLLTPLIPIFILLPFNGWKVYLTVKGLEPPAWDFPIDAALFLGVLYGVLALPRPPQGRIQGFTKNLFDGISASAPVAALIIGIGMIIRVVFDPVVSYYMKPLLEYIVPGSPVLYVIVFSLLAPLALYRGPLNMWGMGLPMAGLMAATGRLEPLAVMAMLMSVGQIQGVSDPTNTHNVWLAGYLGVDVQVFTRKTLPYTWALAVAGLIVAAVMFVK